MISLKISQNNFLTILLILILFFTNKINPHSLINFIFIINEDTVRYENKTTHKKFGDCTNDTENCFNISFNYPIILWHSQHYVKTENDTIKNFLNSIINEMMLSSIYYEKKTYNNEDDFFNDLKNEFENFTNEFPEAASQWDLNRNVKIIYNSNNIISLEYSEYYYLGGAHPNSVVLYKSFNLNNEKQILINDIFTENNFIKLNSIAENIFRKKWKLKKDDDLEKAGFWFENNKFALNNNFAITKDGLIFYYNNYEIAPYVFGPTELFIPFSEIKNLINSNSVN
ncbi:MAG: hypothetical protein STSR0008_00470 [Ignavibacterium sp.]